MSVRTDERYDPPLMVVVVGVDGPVFCFVDSFEAYHLARVHQMAISSYLRWGDSDDLRALAGRAVTTARGTSIPLLTDPIALDSLTTLDQDDGG